LDRANQPQAGAARRTARETPRLRLAPNLYIAQTQPGFETVIASEIAARVPGSREIARRVVPERAGLTIFAAARPEPLAKLRTAEDIFSLVGYRGGLPPASATLDRIRAAVREAPFVAEALQARVRFTPGVRAGKRLRFRVIARVAGEHEFRRVDMQRAVERGMLDRADHTWRLDESQADLEFWATLIGDEFILAVRLSDERLRHREYKIAHRPGSLRPAVAAALAWLSDPRPDDIVLDPFCGAATIPIERAQFGPYRLLIASDRDPSALEAARANIGPRYKPIQIERWDAGAIPLPDVSVTRIITNLPWGERFSSHAENRKLYPRWIAEFNRLIANDGRIVILTAEWRIMNQLIDRGEVAPMSIMRVTILGSPATVYVCRKP